MKRVAVGASTSTLQRAAKLHPDGPKARYAKFQEQSLRKRQQDLAGTVHPKGWLHPHALKRKVLGDEPKIPGWSCAARFWEGCKSGRTHANEEKDPESTRHRNHETDFDLCEDCYAAYLPDKRLDPPPLTKMTHRESCRQQGKDLAATYWFCDACRLEGCKSGMTSESAPNEDPQSVFYHCDVCDGSKEAAGFDLCEPCAAAYAVRAVPAGP